MGVAEKLHARLKVELGLDVVVPIRTYAGARQLESWAWSWAAKGPMGLMVGSSESMTSCVKAVKLVALKPKRNGTIEVVPMTE